MALKARVDESLLATWATASEYHFFHALALLLVGLLAKNVRRLQHGHCRLGIVLPVCWYSVVACTYWC